MTAGFIERHGLWTDEQTRGADEVRRRIEAENIKLVRVAWADSHGAARAKALTVPAFLGALDDGFNINVATFTLDTSGGRVFSSFVRGGGMGLDEMTGSPNLTVAPDPTTFQVLPWAPGVGWILCDEYFPDGTPFHFSARGLLRRQLERLARKDMGLVVGLEIEWYLTRIVDDRLGAENTGVPGRRGRPIETAPLEPGYLYHSETNLDLMQPVLSELAETCEALDLKLRSLENEYGPGQVECTFAADEAMRAADDYVLFRAAARQLCRRLGYFASFMCRPAFPGFFSSGWHLHQSLIRPASGENLFTPDGTDEHLAAPGRSWLAGLLEHAAPATVFAVPTVNGYRRFRPNSLAPDRATWGHDHRGAMIRAMGGVGDAATRLENRAGEPAANPYLFITSQIVAGLDGIERNAEPWPADDNPYEAERPPLPATLHDALAALDQSALFRDALGSRYVEYYLALKRSELDRFDRFVETHGDEGEVGGVTPWEQNEYFDFF